MKQIMLSVMRMKVFGIALVLFFFGVIFGVAGEFELIEKPTQRTREVEGRYGVKAVAMYREGEKAWCIFSARVTKESVVGFPIVVTVDATDAEIKAAVYAALQCAEFYEGLEKKKGK